MIFAVYFPLLLPLLAVPVVRWVGGRLEPVVASWLVLVVAFVLASCSTLALGLLMFAGLSTVGEFARLGHWSPLVLRELDAVHLPVDVGASLLFVVFVGYGVVVGVRRGRALVVAHRMARQDAASGELVVVSDDRPLAHALPGRPGRIVVSTSMLAVLGPDERRALLAHERSHLAHSHHLFVAAVDVLAAVNPLLRVLASTIRYTTERWADEDAAGDVGDRSVVARAVGRAALASKANPVTRAGIALAVTTGPVPRRVAALLEVVPVRRAWSVTGCAVIACCPVFGSVVFLLDAVTDLHRVVELAQYVR
jgi:Zn-dependent protease with chaperone function